MYLKDIYFRYNKSFKCHEALSMDSPCHDPITLRTNYSYLFPKSIIYFWLHISLTDLIFETEDDTLCIRVEGITKTLNVTFK